jgi:hypothetical protein
MTKYYCKKVINITITTENPIENLSCDLAIKEFIGRQENVVKIEGGDRLSINIDEEITTHNIVEDNDEY